MPIRIKDSSTEDTIKSFFKDEATYHAALELGYEQRDTEAQIMNIKCKVEDSKKGMYVSIWLSLCCVEEVYDEEYD